MKLWKRIIFYLRMTEAVFFPKRNSFLNDADLRNSFFMYHSNFLIELGTITNFSCVDKHGVLSWPNPTAEKIWFFTNTSNGESKSNENISAEGNNDEQKAGLTSVGDIDNLTDVTNQIDSNDLNKNEAKINQRGKNNVEKCFLETYYLTHDNANGYELKFDDPNWSRNISVLKPIVSI